MGSQESLFESIASDYKAQLQGRKSLGAIITALLFGRGFHTLLSYRIQRALLKIPLIGKILAKILRYISCAFTGCDISYYASLEGGIYIPHPTGIVIGDYVCVGEGTTILQQVTLGTKMKSGKDYPKIGKNVYLGAGSKIIGAISIGNSCTIGANAVVLENVPNNCTAVGIPSRNINVEKNV